MQVWLCGMSRAHCGSSRSVHRTGHGRPPFMPFRARPWTGIVAAMPSGNTRLTNQRAFYMVISRVRDRTELVTDDAWRLADRLERATLICSGLRPVPAKHRHKNGPASGRNRRRAGRLHSLPNVVPGGRIVSLHGSVERCVERCIRVACSPHCFPLIGEHTSCVRPLWVLVGDRGPGRVLACLFRVTRKPLIYRNICREHTACDQIGSTIPTIFRSSGSANVRECTWPRPWWHLQRGVSSVNKRRR